MNLPNSLPTQKIGQANKPKKTKNFEMSINNSMMNPVKVIKLELNNTTVAKDNINNTLYSIQNPDMTQAVQEKDQLTSR